jgi:hypothetical protein
MDRIHCWEWHCRWNKVYKGRKGLQGWFHIQMCRYFRQWHWLHRQFRELKVGLKKLFIRKRPILALQLRSFDGSSFLTFIHFWSEKRTSLGLQGIFIDVPRFKARKTVLFFWSHLSSDIISSSESKSSS